MATKVAVLNLDWNGNIGRKEFDSMSDAQLIEACESEDFVFTLKSFQEAINDDYLSLEDCFIRFIEVE